MNSDNYKKGTEIYDSVYWLLKHYREFKFYNIMGENEILNDITESEEEARYSISDVIIFAEKEESCTRRLKNLVRYTKSEYCSNLIKLLDRAYRLLVEQGGHNIIYSEILRKRFMLKNTDCSQIEHKGSGYYVQLRHAIEKYCGLFVSVIKRNRTNFSDICTDDDIVREVELMKKAYMIHSKDGICFKDTVKLLKCYREIKYSGIQRRIGDSSEDIENFLSGQSGFKRGYEMTLDRIEYTNLPNNMKKWMYSSMMETTNAYLAFVEEALRRMRWLGEKGCEYRRILDIMFIDPEWDRRSNEEKLKETGLTIRQLYERRRKAIEVLSKILWGILGHRHCNSVFYRM